MPTTFDPTPPSANVKILDNAIAQHVSSFEVNTIYNGPYSYSTTDNGSINVQSTGGIILPSVPQTITLPVITYPNYNIDLDPNQFTFPFSQYSYDAQKAYFILEFLHAYSMWIHDFAIFARSEVPSIITSLAFLLTPDISVSLPNILTYICCYKSLSNELLPNWRYLGTQSAVPYYMLTGPLKKGDDFFMSIMKVLPIGVSVILKELCKHKKGKEVNNNIKNLWESLTKEEHLSP